MCRKCCKYGHTEKRCFSSVVVCGKCAEAGHRSDDCDSEIVQCSSCSGAHTSGHNTCTDKKKEQRIREIQKEQKVGRAMARQIFETWVSVNTGNKEIKPYAKYIDIKVDYEQRRKLCPFRVEKTLERELNITAQQITDSKNGYTIRCIGEEISNKAIGMKNLMGLYCASS